MNTITFELSQEDRARLDKIIELLGGKPIEAPQKLTEATQKPQESTKTSVKEETPTKEEKPAEKPTEAAEHPVENPFPAPDRRTVKSVAVKKIQAGHRDEVKALIQAYGAEKIDLVPEDKLSAFLNELEAI